MRAKETKVTWLLIIACFSRTIWCECCLMQFDKKWASKPMSKILEDCRNVSRELASAAPSINRKLIAERTSNYLELLADSIAREEDKMDFDRLCLEPSRSECNDEEGSKRSLTENFDTGVDDTNENAENETEASSKETDQLLADLANLGFT
ncbi:hypothetical protein R1flu_005802 [Riccia fluitans]|uniref:Uncharacterized protein n=1 Tax=Riccia fluitans TaxID=41844 RepID=A0ABD1YU81_9MARC